MSSKVLRSISVNSDSEPKIAVDVQNVVFGYRPNIKVLNKISFKVTEGKIFAILGSDGSGKSTLLRLLCGRFKPKIGRIKVFGKQPGPKHPDIPGPGIGFMPQESGLSPELTINETLVYYGMIFHMSDIERERRIGELAQMWALEERDVTVGELTKDQLRIVSIACAMVHSPKLLVLDEPTVGIDTMLKYKIWSQLEKYNRQQGTTIIMTSNYISEARRAHSIAFTYSGKCLRFGRSNRMLSDIECKTFEDCYHKLCAEYIRKSKQSFKYMLEEEENKRIRMQDILSGASDDDNSDAPKKSIDCQHLKAMLYQNRITLKYHLKILVLLLVLPILQIFLISLCFGRPNRIPIAIFNDEHRPEMSKALIDRLDDHLFRKTFFKSNESAVDSVVRGNNYLSLGFDHEFSDAMRKRFLDPYHLTPEENYSTQIRVFADMSDPITTSMSFLYIIQTFSDKFIDFFRHLMGNNAHVLRHPLVVEELIHSGTVVEDIGYHQFLYPAVVLQVVWLNTILLTTFLAFRMIKSESAHFERKVMCGVTGVEILITRSLLVIPFVIMQSLVAISVQLHGYPLLGSALDLFLLLLFQSLHGLTFGTTLTLMFQKPLNCIFVSCLLLNPIFWFTSGMIWPLESMSAPIRLFASIFTPLCRSTVSFRYIAFRGWSPFTSIETLIGYLNVIVHCVLLTFINVKLIKNF